MLIYGVELIEADDKVLQHQRRTGQPFEAESVEYWLAACKPGAVVVDVGAYTGLYSILAAKNGARAHAFEPNHHAFARLQDNVAANGVQVYCSNCAVGAAHGETGMVTNGATLTSGTRCTPGRGVEVLPLDSLELRQCDAIKIDVEGMERLVLEGARELLRKHHPLLITEALNDAAFAEQYDFLINFGYFPKKVDQWNVVWL